MDFLGILSNEIQLYPKAILRLLDFNTPMQENRVVYHGISVSKIFLNNGIIFGIKDTSLYHFKSLGREV